MTEADPTIVARLAAYQAMKTPELVTEYVRLFGAQPRCKHPVWLRRNVAWKLQEQRYGGLSQIAQNRLEQLMAEIEIPGCGTGATAPPPRPREPGELPVGTTLTRDWRGRQIRVTATHDGFDLDGRPFRSLSAVAHHVTGTKWNGRAWFGLAPLRSRR